MKDFAIRRSLEPTLTRADVDAAAMQSLLVLSSGIASGAVDDWAPPDLQGRVNWLDVRWIRSYWHPGGNSGVCLYTGPTHQAVEEMNVNCGAAFDDIVEVDTIDAPALTHAATRHAQPSDPDARLFSVECFLPDFTDEDVCSDIAQLLRTAGADELPAFVAGQSAVEWIRAYWRSEDGWLLALYATTDDAWLDDVPESGLQVGGAVLRPIVEIAPADYLGFE